MRERIYKSQAVDAICLEWCDCKNKDCKHVFDPEHDDDYFCDGCRDAEIIKNLCAAPKDKSYTLWKESYMELKRRYDALVAK